MKKMIALVLSVGMSSVISAADIDGAANDICKCMKNESIFSEKTMKKIQKAYETGDYSSLMSDQEALKNIMESSSQCFEKLPAKYPDIDKSKALQDKVMALSAQRCPNPVFSMFKR